MSKKDIILRQEINAPLTTKGSELTFADYDNSLIAIYNSLVSLSQSSNVDAYDAAANYYLDNAVMYSGQLYKCIVAGPITAVTPTDVAGWDEIYATDLVSKPKPYKLFSAILNQVGTNAPTMVILENELSGIPVWSRSNIGLYKLTLSNEFTTDKTLQMVGGSNYSPDYNFLCYSDSENYVKFESFNGLTLEDDLVSNIAIEIKVYN
tara:strand:+ start:173 stop:793 length:621 start_codon:yes stop_codon:yes gene_type:complete